jgi:hypothetical protein
MGRPPRGQTPGPRFIEYGCPPRSDVLSSTVTRLIGQSPSVQSPVCGEDQHERVVGDLLDGRRTFGHRDAGGVRRGDVDGIDVDHPREITRHRSRPSIMRFVMRKRALA